VELCHNNEWGTVCRDSWNTYDGVVVCRQLGFTPYITSVQSFGPGVGKIWLDNLRCTSTENRLIDCPHDGFGVHDCSHDKDAGLSCIGKCQPVFNWSGYICITSMIKTKSAD